MARNNMRTTKRAPKDLGRRIKKKPCQLCKDRVEWVDYKNARMLKRYMSERGKIRARRVSGNCEQHQRDIAEAIKTARELALLPYTQRTVTERRGGGRGRDRDGGPGTAGRRRGADARVRGVPVQPIRAATRRAWGALVRRRAAGGGRCRRCRLERARRCRRGRTGRGGGVMKVLLRKDIDGVGRRGDIVDVKGGYARNFLLPSGSALVASDAVAQQASSMRRARDLKDAQDLTAAQTQKAAIESRKLIDPRARERAGEALRLRRPGRGRERALHPGGRRGRSHPGRPRRASEGARGRRPS